MSRATISGPRQRQPRLDRIARQRRADLAHRPRQIDLHHLAGELRFIDLRQEMRRVGLELLEEDALGVDLAEDLAIGGTGNAETDRHAGAMPRQADDAHVVAEIFAAELRADAHLARQRQHLLLEIAVAEGLARGIALARQRIEIAAARELHGLQIHLGRGAADDDREVIGRAGRGAEGADLLVEEFEQRIVIQHCRRLLEEKALIRRAAALGDEEEFVFIALGRRRDRSAPADCRRC